MTDANTSKYRERRRDKERTRQREVSRLAK